MKTRLLLLFLLGAGLAGCGGGKHPIEGRVVWLDNGQPATELAGYNVDFESHEAKVSATGVIRPDATFDLSTDRAGDGVYAGTYKIAVNRPLPDGDTRPPPSLLPAHYGKPETSGLTETIDGKKKVVELKLERRKK